MNYIRILTITLLLLIASTGQAQDTSIFSQPIQMDEFVLRASQSGWDVQAFIRRVKNDTTFYKAFRTMRLVPYSAENDIRIFNKRGRTKAALHSRTRQVIEGNCRRTLVEQEQVSGNYFKRNGEHRYYTAELYDYLFFTEQPVCGEDNIVSRPEPARNETQIEKRKNQLKQLIFNPGSKVAGVPFAGNKAAIFDEEISKMYDFKLLSVEYDGEDCYLFSAVPKPEFRNEVVYNELSTWFRRSDWSIVARDYSLSFKTLLYDFDVRMKVRLRNINGRLLPSRISYDGNWHIATQGRERAVFQKTISY